MKISLKAARINSGYTQKEAAKLLNICESTLINYEKCRSVPNIKLISKIEKLYGVNSENINFFE